MDIKNHIFDPTKHAVEQHTDTSLSVELIRNDVVNEAGDIETVSTHEGIKPNSAKQTHLLDQTKIRIINDDGEYYAEAIYKQFQADPTITLLEWIEVVDPPLRGNGIGRTLLENTIDHIDQTTETEFVYTKVVNPHMIGPNIDCGFEPVAIASNEDWHCLQL